MSEIIEIRPTPVARPAIVKTLPEAVKALPEPVKALPEPRTAISVRLGTNDDIPFVDALMKKHSKQLAFLPTEALEGKVALRELLIAETASGQRAGYLIGNDRYKSRDELGVIYQICVDPQLRRMLVGAHLLKARFETSAYGCKLYCCWCAQDLTSSNEFYESMGFVPIAYRAGSEKKKRTHIFWQKRIRAGDTETDWWFPAETRGGLMNVAKIALPIPPGLTWRDELPRLEIPAEAEPGSESDAPTQGAPTPKKSRAKKQEAEPAVAGIRRGGLRLRPLPTESAPVEEKPAKEKPKRIRKAPPELVARARELRDRYMEQFNAQGSNLAPALPGWKYEVTRIVEALPHGVDELATIEIESVKQLAA